MGKIRAPHGYFLDLASEEIACSSGMLLSDQNLKALASRYEIDELSYLERGVWDTVVRPEDFEDAILCVQRAIGTLPDTKPGQFVVMDACATLFKKGVDAKKSCLTGGGIQILEAYVTVSESGRYSTVTDEAMEEIIKLSGRRESTSTN